MKKILLITLLAATASVANAGDYDYLVVQTTSGAEQSSTAIGTVISFADGKMTVTPTSGDTQSYTVADLSKMYFSSQAAGISNIQTESQNNEIYNVNGQRMLNNESLNKGVYVIKNKDSKTSKKIVK